MNQHHKKRPAGGFALIATVSMMVLLALIAVAMLSLATITSRTSSYGATQAEARANARLALMLAIGELQKYSGPDTAVTATSNIISSSPEKSHLTGVWSSWDYDPLSSSLDYEAEKNKRFQGWLVSSPNSNLTKN